MSVAERGGGLSKIGRFDSGSAGRSRPRLYHAGERKDSMKTGLLAVTVGACLVSVMPLPADAATPPVPTISAPISGPGLMYPNPAISVVPTAPKVEDFPYVTEEFFVSGTAKDAPYTTRIIVRRPKDPERVQRRRRVRGAARRRPIADLRVVARVDPDAAAHVRRDRAQPREHQPAEDVQRRALRVAEHRDGPDQRRHRAGRHG